MDHIFLGAIQNILDTNCGVLIKLFGEYVMSRRRKRRNKKRGGGEEEELGEQITHNSELMKKNSTFFQFGSIQCEKEQRGILPEGTRAHCTLKSGFQEVFMNVFLVSFEVVFLFEYFSAFQARELCLHKEFISLKSKKKGY